MEKEEKRSPYVTNGDVKETVSVRKKIVNVRDIANDIVEMFDDILDRYGIIVPDEDRGLESGETSLYGMTYAKLTDAVSDVLSDVVKAVDPSVVTKDVCNYTNGNYSKYFDISTLKKQHGEFTQMLTISTLHVSEETVEKLDAVCDDSMTVDHWMPPVYEKDGYGWFIYVDPDRMDEDIPTDLKAVLTYAATSGCTWLCMDADADPIPELPVYERQGEDNE